MAKATRGKKKTQADLRLREVYDILQKDMSFVGRDHKRVNTSESYAMNQPEGVGKAYAFLHYDGPKKDIEQSLPAVRDLNKVPAGLEISVMGRADGFNDDFNFNKLIDFDRPLRVVATEAEQEGMNYVIEARHPGASSRQTAVELHDVMLGVSQCIYKRKEEVRGEIFYARGNKYVFKR